MRNLTVDEVDKLPLPLRCCYFVQPWNTSFDPKCVDDWSRMFFGPDERYVQYMANDVARLVRFIESECAGVFSGTGNPVHRNKTDIMTPDEFLAAMQEIAKNGDEEGRHLEADALICKMLRQLGYGMGVDVFNGMQKWYA